MKSISLPTYAELNHIFLKTTLKFHPSEVHGIMCGILCGGQKANPSIWDEWATQQQLKKYKMVQNLYVLSAQQLLEFLFEFQLVLPKSTEELSTRAQALTMLCQGFLTGLKIVNVPLTGRPPSEITEAINDLIEISKMNYEEVVAGEEDESAFTQLVEYVRMAIILIYQELHASSTQVRLKQESKPDYKLH